MARKVVFADEAGNFDFSKDRNASRYFILTTVVIDEHERIESELLRLRRNLAWENMEIAGAFHATEDKQAVRDQVFELIQGYDVRIDATIFEKSKCQPHQRTDEVSFYKFAWFFHMKYLAPHLASNLDEMLIVAASINTRAKALSFRLSVEQVMAQTSTARDMRVKMWPAATDPCLQVADYCCWAIQRKWELGDDRSYNLVKGKIYSEFDIFRRGKDHYY